MSFSDYLEGKVLDHVFRDTAYSQPSTIYLALFTADPGETGDLGLEASNHANYSSGYSRQAVSFDRSGNILTNSSQVSFGPIATTGNITITYAAVLDASTSGNVLASEAINESRVLTNGGYLVLDAGALEIRLF